MRPPFLRLVRLLFLFLLTVSVAHPVVAETPGASAPIGVVLDSRQPATALAAAGLESGDVLLRWKRSATASSPAAEGTLRTPYDWSWLINEQVPRGAVELIGLRQGEPAVWPVPPGAWRSQVRPRLTGEAETMAQEARRLREASEPEEALAALGRLVGLLKERGDGDREAWARAQWGRTLAREGRSEEALAQYREAPKVAATAAARAYATKELALFLWRTGAMEGAEEALRTAAEICAQSWADSLAGAEGLNHLGFLVQRLGRPDEAQALFERAGALTETYAPESLLHSSSLGNLGLALAAQGSLDAAQELLDRSLALVERLAPDSLDVAITNTNLGIVKRNLGDLEGAEKAYRRALEIEEALEPGGPATATVLTNLSELNNELGRTDEALELLNRALAIRQKHGSSSLEQAITLNNLGETYLNLGDLQNAEKHLLEARALLEEAAPESWHMAACLGTLGLVEWKRGDLGRATELIERASGLFRKLAPQSSMVAHTLTHLGSFAVDEGDFETAKGYLSKAVEVYTEADGSSKVDSVPVLLKLAELARREENGEEALRYANRAATILHRESVEGPRGANLETLRGDLALDAGDFAAALLHHRRAVELWDQIAPESTGAAEAGWRLAVTLRRAGLPNEAADRYLTVLDVLDRQAATLGATSSVETAFRARRTPIYVEAIETLLTLERAEEALHVAERSRARVLLEMLSQRELRFTNDLPADLDRARRDNARAYDRTLARLVEAEGGSPRHTELSRKLDQLQREREHIARQIRQSSPAVAALADPPLTFDQAAAALDSTTAVLYYVVGERSTTLFVLRRGQPLRTVDLPVSEERLRASVGQFLQSIESRSSRSRLDEQAGALGRLLIEPARAWVAASPRLLIVPDGPLHRLPFSALRVESEATSTQYLVEWKPTHSAVSLTVYHHLRQRKAASGQAPSSLTAFGDPLWNEGEAAQAPEGAKLRGFEWSPLPYSRREVESIASLFPDSRTYLGAEATETRAKGAASDSRRVHFATHGFLDQQRALDSALIFSRPGSAGDNGLLQVWEIFEQVRLDAELVVLSACDTALGRELSGEGLIGLTRAFHFAGARTVAATLWAVADQPTGELMTRFYRHLAEGHPTDAALRGAQLELLASPIRLQVGDQSVELDASAPYFWAGFQLYGSWQ